MSVSEQIETAVSLYFAHRFKVPVGVALNPDNYFRLKSELSEMMHARRWQNMSQLPEMETSFFEEKQIVINTAHGSLNVYRHDAMEPLILLHV